MRAPPPGVPFPPLRALPAQAPHNLSCVSCEGAANRPRTRALPRSPRYPPEVGAIDGVDKVLDALEALDDGFESRVAEASSTGAVLRYCALLRDQACSVGLQALPADSPLGRLSGSDNLIEFDSAIYNDAPLVVQGAGAGADVTAAGVHADAAAAARILLSGAAA